MIEKYEFNYCGNCGCELIYEEEYDMCYSCYLESEKKKGKLICPGNAFLMLQTMKFREKDEVT